MFYGFAEFIGAVSDNFDWAWSYCCCTVGYFSIADAAFGKLLRMLSVELMATPAPVALAPFVPDDAVNLSNFSIRC